MIECANHQGGYDCTPFCNLCEGNQEHPTKEITEMTMQNDIRLISSELTIKQQLRWHLVSNHFPPISATMVEACLEAIDACNAYNHTRLISLPSGTGYKGLTAATAGEIARLCNLDQWTIHD